MKPDLWVQMSLGLGDAIILNGLIHTLAKERVVFIPCYEHNLPSVTFMFKGANVVPIMVPTHEYAVELGKKFHSRLLLGFDAPDFDRTHFDQSFYEQAGMPFRLSWDAFSYPTPLGVAPPPQKPFKFVHSDVKRGYLVDVPGPVYHPGGLENIFDYIPVMLEAEEFHGFDSCFALLCDRIGFRGKKVLHKYARPGADEPTYKNGWEILR